MIDNGHFIRICHSSHCMDLLYQTVENLHESADEIPISLKPILRYVKCTSYGKIG